MLAVTRILLFVATVINGSVLGTAYDEDRFEFGFKFDEENSEPEHNHAESSCKWTDRPENGLNTISCSTGQCTVKRGSYSKHGSRRNTKCRKHFVLAKGFDMDICQDGAWTSSGHKCIQCGKSPEDFNPVQASPLIHAGFNSTSGAFPWMAALYTSLEEGFWDQICGGTLITPSVVLTAAHCLEIRSRKLNAEELKIGLGKLLKDFYTHEEGAMIISARELLRQEGYTGSQHLYNLDIGLITLTKSVSTNSRIMPACLDNNPIMRPKHHELGVLAGWGVTGSSGAKSSVLKWTFQKFIAYEKCRLEILDNTEKKFLTHDKFCSGDVEGGKADKGDSGGGLTFVRDGTHYVYGLVSTKIGDDKKVRLFTNLMDDSHWSWLLRKLRSFQVQLVAESDSCSSNEDCAADKACVREKCADPCSGACEEDYVCEARNHLATCYQRDDHMSGAGRCSGNEDCAADKACVNRKCANPCTDACREGYVCHVRAHIATCSQQRQKVQMSAVGRCSGNEDCAADKACVNRKCANPCTGACGEGYACEVRGHIPSCSQQRPIVASRPDFQSTIVPMYGSDNCSECTGNEHCDADMACVGSLCVNPCIGFCGGGDFCEVRAHLPTCSQPGKERNLHTNDENYGYTFLPAGGNSVVKFKVKARSDAHIMLSETTDPYSPQSYYEIVISGWDNSKSVITRDRNFGVKTQTKTPKFLSGNEFRGFWIKNSDGTISVGQENEEAPFVIWTDPMPLSVKYIGFATGFGSTGDWIVSGAGRCVDDQGCLEDRACVSGACVDPCAGACKQNNFCKVKAHNPICSQSSSSLSVGCSSHGECPNGKGCISGRCANPCKNACSEDQFCEAETHNAVCSYPGKVKRVNTRSTNFQYTYTAAPIGSLIRFRVKAPSDAHVMLSEYENPSGSQPYYEIVLGGWGNSMSAIRKDRKLGERTEADSPNLMSNGEFRGFWIKFGRGSIAVGKENEVNPFMVWTDPSPFKINYYGVNTGFGSSGQWILYE